MDIVNELTLRYSDEDIVCLLKSKVEPTNNDFKGMRIGEAIIVPMRYNYKNNSTTVDYADYSLHSQIKKYIPPKDDSIIIGYSIIGFHIQPTEVQQKIAKVLVEDLLALNFKHVTEQYPHKLIVAGGESKPEPSIGKIFKYCADMIAKGEAFISKEEPSASKLFKHHVKKILDKHNWYFIKRGYFKSVIHLSDGDFPTRPGLIESIKAGLGFIKNSLQKNI
ncbi:MAG: hypothetical protein FWF23_06240 [Alphaproteobacteria bacterium]|nr:hypothetical protein [Alphaproteobacteria bacterium]MCL2505793.1 hypothetical protein [Alphaproteobacteria bacterium]